MSNKEVIVRVDVDKLQEIHTALTELSEIYDERVKVKDLLPIVSDTLKSSSLRVIRLAAYIRHTILEVGKSRVVPGDEVLNHPTQSLLARDYIDKGGDDEEGIEYR